MDIDFINFTPHSINIDSPSGRVEIPPSGKTIRVTTTDDLVGEIIGVEVVKTSIVGVEGLEGVLPGAKIIVSSMVLDTLAKLGIPEGITAYAPDTGSTAVRDERGQIVAVRRLRTV